MRALLFVLFVLGINALSAQVEGVDYLMRYNCETNEYDVHIVILEGSATTIPQRAQFNSQISLVVPTGETVEITNHYMPLQNNQSYDSNVPMMWSLGSPVIAPEAQPENDFYSVVPRLSPASFYNDLNAGDEVKLFSFIAGDSGTFDENVRFYNNGVDPDDTAPGMQGGSFANGFTLGGSFQLYNDNSVENCSITSSEERFAATDVTVYPNPFQQQLTIESDQKIKSVSLIGNDGRRYAMPISSESNKVNIDAIDLPDGIYTILIEGTHGTTMQKVVKFLK